MNDAQKVAEESAKAMFANDRATQALGMKVEEVRPGYARMSMKVREDMLNGHDICHGGFIFTLADSSFAFACNSYGAVTVAAGADIEFLIAGKKDDVLVAEAVERAKGNRLGTYDISVTNQNGETLALFRGRSYSTRHKIVDA